MKILSATTDMLRLRVIPCLLWKNGGLVKTVKFKNPTYVGDATNAIRIFNEKEVDELILLDIDASKKGGLPNIDLIKQIASELCKENRARQKAGAHGW